MNCPECKSECLETANFCSYCGAVFNSKLNHQGLSQGERKIVTVLFSDLSGYTSITEKLDPEDVKDIMGTIFNDISAVVTQYDGRIEKFVGDSVMAVFGVPHAHEDDPARAIRAAKQIHDLVAALSPELEKRIGRRLSMHSGINTGLVVTGEVDRLKGTCGLVGDTINLASRLQDLAEENEILVGEETYKFTKSQFSFQPVKPAKVKGKAEPVAPFKLLSSVQERTIEHRLQGVQAELIGRETQMALLNEAVQKLQSGQGGIISIVGNAGTGKSRLIKDFKATLNLEEIQWREGHSYPYTQNTPYYPLINLLTNAFKIQEGDTADIIRAKIARGIKNLLWNRSEILPYVGGLFSLSYDEIDDLSPEYRREKFKQAITEILEALARRAPTIVWIEDLHWADAASLQLLDQLMINTRLPILFILVYRPVFTLFTRGVPDNLAWPYQKIEIKDLSSQHIQDMLLSLLKTKAVPGELGKFVQDQVEGNPFYLEEVINALIESRLLIQDDGQWKLTGPITQAAVPSTIQGVLTARLDKLEAESKRILQQASVIGRAFFFEVLKRITDLSTQLQSQLAGLEKLDLIRTRSLEPDLEYIFKHALTQEVVYNGLLKKERRELHESIAAVIEEMFTDRLPEFYEVLAHHYQRGKSTAKAIDYLIKSGQKAQNQFCLEEANHYYETAFSLLKTKSELTLEEQTNLIDLLFAWAWVAYIMADWRRVLPILVAHLTVAENIGDQSRYAMLMAWIGWAVLMKDGDVNKCLLHLHKAMEIANELNETRLMAYCCTWLCWAYSFVDLKDKHLLYGKQAIDLAEKIGKDNYLNHKALAAIAFGGGSSGQWKKGLEAAEKAIELGKKQSHLRGMAIGYSFQSQCLFSVGRFSEAEKLARSSLETATDPLYEYFAKLNIGMANLYLGNIQKALEKIEEVQTAGNSSELTWLSYYCTAALGVIFAGSGHLQKGLDSLNQAQQYFEKMNLMTQVCFCRLLKGTIFAQLAAPQQKPDASVILKNSLFLIKHLPRAAKNAEVCFRTVISTGTVCGANFFVARAYQELGNMLLAKKKLNKAKENLKEAKDIFSELENDYYLEQVEKSLAQLNQ